MFLKCRITTEHSFANGTGVNLVQSFLTLDFENRLRPSLPTHKITTALFLDPFFIPSQSSLEQLTKD